METVERNQSAARASERTQELEPAASPEVASARPNPSSAGANRFAQVMGILFFLFGIGIIVFVLLQAFQLYQDPTGGVSGGRVVNPSAEQIGKDLIGLIVKIALLFLGSISGSLIANKGINLYFSALRRE